MTLAEVEIPKTKEELEAQLVPNPFFEILEEETVEDTSELTLKGKTGDIDLSSDIALSVRPPANINIGSTSGDRSEINFIEAADLDSDNSLDPRYQFYQEANNANLVLKHNATNGPNLTLSPLNADITGKDECNLTADDGTNNSDILIEPTSITIDINTSTGKVKFVKDSNDTVIRFTNLGSVPAVCTIGDICVSGAKLQICTSTNTWTIIGTQT